MEAEPAPMSAASPAPVTDADMSVEVNYDEPDAALDGEHGGDDAMMGDDALAPRGDEASVEEAEMADDEAGGWEKDAPMVEEESAAVSESFSSSALEAPIPVDEVPPTTSAAFLPPALAVSVPMGAPLAPASGDGPSASTPLLAASSAASDLPPAAAAVEAPLEEALAAPHFPLTAPLDSASADAEALEPTVDEVATDIGIAPPVERAAAEEAGEPASAPAQAAEEAPAWSSDAEPSALSLTAGAASAAVEVEVFAPTDIGAPPPDAQAEPAEPSAAVTRPAVAKDPLLPIDVPSQPSASADPSARGVPPVFLSYDNSTYSLFHSHRLLASAAAGADEREGGESTEANEEEAPLMLGNAEQHALYYEPIETLFRVIREQFVDLHDQQDELVLDFDEIGIALGEDNVYCSQVTLFDFDRIHLGCQLPGRLHARLYTQGRFATGFNALAQHIANSYGIEPEAPEDGMEEGADEEDASVTVEAEEGEERDDGEPHVSDGGVADDHDGPDSELVSTEHESGEGEGAEAYERAGEDHEHLSGEDEGTYYGEDDFDLDEALAQLDGDDVVAVVEGAQEDLVLSQHGEQEEVDQQEEALPASDVLQPEAEGEGELEIGGEGEGGPQPPQEAEEPKEEYDKVELTPSEDLPPVEAETVGEVDLAQVAAEEGELPPGTDQRAPIAGEDALAPQIPVTEESAAVNRDGQADDAEPVLAGESAGAVGDVSASVDESELALEEPADPADVVIDYDEAFDGVSTPRREVQALPPVAPREPATAPTTAIGIEAAKKEEVSALEKVVPPTPLSPKRSRESFLDGQQETGDEVNGEEDANDAKRQRLSGPIVSSA
ncbi:hypothetical protein JCM10213_008354 [Rhodosporidiobolus nylandii]